ncbi:MAG: ComF family protein [Nonlabens sp.]
MSIVTDILNLIYPEVCLGCETPLLDLEDVLCTSCIHLVPIAHHNLESDDKVRDLFYGRVDVIAGTSLFFYEKIGVVQQMIHQLKYKGRQEVGTLCGRWMGQLLRDDERYGQIDYVVPVPVHKQRLRQRGYNQVTKFGEEIGDALGSRFRESVLIKTRNTRKQAQLGQRQRSDETQSPYELREPLPSGSAVLLVDDVITTGTTLSLCAKALQKIEGVQIYVATIAVSV